MLCAVLVPRPALRSQVQLVEKCRAASGNVVVKTTRQLPCGIRTDRMFGRDIVHKNELWTAKRTRGSNLSEPPLVFPPFTILLLIIRGLS